MDEKDVILGADTKLQAKAVKPKQSKAGGFSPLKPGHENDILFPLLLFTKIM